MSERIITLSKTFRWEMAHRLQFHQSGCRNIHGHSYEMDVIISGEPDENGMLLEYGLLKARVKPVVDELDHAFLCCSRDELIVPFLKQSPFKVVYVDFETTAENIVFYMIDKIKPLIRPFFHIRSLKIIIRETTTSSASAECELKDGDS